MINRVFVIAFVFLLPLPGAARVVSGRLLAGDSRLLRGSLASDLRLLCGSLASDLRMLRGSLARDSNGPAVLCSEFIYDAAAFPECHAATIAETPNGLVAAFFGGTRERDPDVCIYLSRKAPGLGPLVSASGNCQWATSRFHALSLLESGPLSNSWR